MFASVLIHAAKMLRAGANASPIEPAGDGATNNGSDDCAVERPLPPQPPLPPPPVPALPPLPPVPIGPPHAVHIESRQRQANALNVEQTSMRNSTQYTMRRPALWFWYAWDQRVYVDNHLRVSRPQAEFDWSDANRLECWRHLCYAVLEEPGVSLHMRWQELIRLCHRGGRDGGRDGRGAHRSRA